MRRIILISSLVMVALSIAVFPVNGAEPSHVITLNPLGFLFGVYSLNYESVASEGHSYVVSGNLISLKQGSWEISGIGAGMTLRFYPRRTAPRGFYCGPSVMAGAVSVKYTDPYGETLTGRGASVGVGGIAGFQWISRDGFTFDLNASVTVGLSQISAGEYSTPAGSVTSSIGLSMGYAW